MPEGLAACVSLKLTEKHRSCQDSMCVQLAWVVNWRRPGAASSEKFNELSSRSICLHVYTMFESLASIDQNNYSIPVYRNKNDERTKGRSGSPKP